MVQDIAIFTMADQWKVACGLSNGASLVFKVTPFFDTKYLTNGYRYGHSYYRRRIGNRTQAFKWYHFR